MATQALTTRIDNLEGRVTHLEALPAHVDALTFQVSQLRDEVHAEFSGIRGEIQVGDEETRRVLRDEIRAGDEETRRAMRVLHEDLVGRLALIQEGANGRRASTAARRKR